MICELTPARQAELEALFVRDPSLADGCYGPLLAGELGAARRAIWLDCVSRFLDAGVPMQLALLPGRIRRPRTQDGDPRYADRLDACRCQRCSSSRR